MADKRRLRIAEHPYMPSRGKGVGWLLKPTYPGADALYLFARGEMPDDQQLGHLVNKLRDEGYEVAVERELRPPEARADA